MVNHLFNGKTGFAWGVRAVSFLDLGLLLTANAIMRTRLPPRPKNAKPIDIRGILRELPFWMCLIGRALFKRVFSLTLITNRTQVFAYILGSVRSQYVSQSHDRSHANNMQSFTSNSLRSSTTLQRLSKHTRYAWRTFHFIHLSLSNYNRLQS
jgi:hypothetical protein